MQMKNMYEEKINALVQALDLRQSEMEEYQKSSQDLEMQNKSLAG